MTKSDRLIEIFDFWFASKWGRRLGASATVGGIGIFAWLSLSGNAPPLPGGASIANTPSPTETPALNRTATPERLKTRTPTPEAPKEANF